MLSSQKTHFKKFSTCGRPLHSGTRYTSFTQSMLNTSSNMYNLSQPFKTFPRSQNLKCPLPSPPFPKRSLLQESPFLREGTIVPSPRRGASCKTPLSRERKVFHNPSLPRESMSFNMLPSETAHGSCTLRLYAPSTLSPSAQVPKGLL